MEFSEGTAINVRFGSLADKQSPAKIQSMPAVVRKRTLIVGALRGYREVTVLRQIKKPAALA
jgi:hypothetical protein